MKRLALVVTVVYAAPDNDPPPPKDKKKESSEVRPSTQETAEPQAPLPVETRSRLVRAGASALTGSGARGCNKGDVTASNGCR